MHPDGQLESTVPALDELESPRAKLVYLYVTTTDGATIERLCDDLDVKKGTVLSITGTLRERGYLERTDAGFEVV